MRLPGGHGKGQSLGSSCCLQFCIRVCSPSFIYICSISLPMQKTLIQGVPIFPLLATT